MRQPYALPEMRPSHGLIAQRWQRAQQPSSAPTLVRSERAVVCPDQTGVQGALQLHVVVVRRWKALHSG